MISYINRIRHRQRKNRDAGSADMIAALALTPIILGLFFAMIDVSLWLNTKASIEAATRDGVRIGAMWGGTSKGVRLNTSGKKVDDIIKSKFYDSDKNICKQSNCTKPPQVKCYVGGNPTKYVANMAGQTIRCDVTYYYKSIFFGSDLMGFGSITKEPIKTSMTGISETGYK